MSARILQFPKFAKIIDFLTGKPKESARLRLNPHDEHEFVMNRWKEIQAERAMRDTKEKLMALRDEVGAGGGIK